MICALGKDVQGFAKGDRCVADNSASVRTSQYSHAGLIVLQTFPIASVKTAFTAERARTCYARTLPVRESQWMEGLPSSSRCKFLRVFTPTLNSALMIGWPDHLVIDVIWKIVGP